MEESRPARGGWIEMTNLRLSLTSTASRPARGGWIEMHYLVIRCGFDPVPSRKGRVD